MGYDEIIGNLFISATSKGFSVFPYPITFFKNNGITKQKAFSIADTRIGLALKERNIIAGGEAPGITNKEPKPCKGEILWETLLG